MTKIGRREILRGGIAVSALASVGAITGCGGSSTTAGGPTPSGPSPPAPPPAGAPRLGAHALVFNAYTGTPVAPLSIAPITTEQTGSTLLVCVGRGLVSTHARPRDNKGNNYTQLGGTRTYSLWPSSGTALYCSERGTGGSGHIVTADKSEPVDETTMAVVEVVNGGTIQDVQWREARAGEPLRSPTVTTTGPAVLVAWWWGDADVQGDKTAVPDSGFTVIDSVLRAGALVQCAVAVREVANVGTYGLTWTSTPVQGAQLWLVAVQRS
jgi:hypothetical protein